MKKLLFCLLALSCCVLSAQWKLIRGEAAADKAFSRISGTGVFQKNYTVKPGKIYLFSADVTSPHEVYFNFSPVGGDIKKIACSTPGKKQRLMGLVASSGGPNLRAQLVVAQKAGETAPTVVENIQLREFDPFKAGFSVKPVKTVTMLDKNAAIIIPRDAVLKGKVMPLARKISKKLGGIPIVDDAAACEKNAPMLKKEYADKNLIIVGNLNNNRAIWPAYTRTLAASDAFYPGGNGYELRTAVNVLSNGKNHIIIGGSSDAGILSGMERFLGLCKPAQKMLLDIQLDGACAKQVNADIADWKKNFPRGKGRFPGTSPGYDAVRRWYHHALMYYWTGNSYYRNMAKKFFKPVIVQKAYTHHYIMEWLIRSWEATRNTDIYTAADRKAMEELIFANYVELQIGADTRWTRPMVPPYRRLRINSRHVTAPLWCQLMASDYVYRNFALKGDLAALVNFTRDEIMAGADHIANTRTRPNSDLEKGDNFAELPLAVFRYAFMFNKFEVFQSKKALEWGNFQLFVNSDRDNIFFGRFQRLPIIAAILGSYYRDPEIKFYEVNAPGGKWSRAMFADRYPNNINTFNNDLKPVLPRKDFKLTVMEFSDSDRFFLTFWKDAVKKYPDLKSKPPIVGAFMRNGLKEDFTVFGMNGVSGFVKGSCGEISNLSFRRRNFLNSTWTAVYSHNSGLPLEKNVVHITRDGQSLNEENAIPRGGFLEWGFNLGGRQAFSCRFVDFNGTVWNRAAVMLNPDQILVHDTIAAEKSDTYNISVVWRPMGKNILPAGKDTLYTSHGRYRFAINLSGKGFVLKTNTASYLKKESEKLLSLFSFDGRIEKGQTVTASSLLQINKKTKVYDCGNGRVLLFEGNKAVAELRLTRNGYVEISRKFIGASNVKEITVGSHKIKIADRPTDVFWGLEKGSCYRDKAGFRRVPAAENKKVRDICHAYLDSLKKPAAAKTQQKSAAVEKKNSFKLIWKNNILKSNEVYSTPGNGLKSFDIGRVAEVSYCRSLGIGESMPEWLEYSVDGKNFKRIKLADPVWKEGVWTHNYGNIALRKKGFQELYLPQKIRGRYFRLPAKLRFQLHFSDRQKPLRAPKILETSPFIIAAPEVVKIYPRGYNYDNGLWGVMDHSGKTLFVKKPQLAPHEIRFLDFPAKNSIGTANPDGRLRFYDTTGKEIMMIDTLAELRAFHKKYGRSNTRHPAGGFASTYSLGSWNNPASLVAGRYGQTSFYRGPGDMTGIRAGGVYCISNMLPRGVDFDGDGHDELLAMSCRYLIHYIGKPNVTPPVAGTTWPQVYDRIQHTYRSRWGHYGYGVWGPKVFTFKAMPWKGKNRYAVSIDRIRMFVYNGAKRNYAWSGDSFTPTAAADIAAVGDAKWIAAVASDDRVLAVYEWLDPDKVPRIISKCVVDDEIKGVAVSGKGRVFAAGSKGIYEIVKGRAVMHIAGSFTDVKCRNDELICAAADGTVSAWKE